jgi:hypothetical protein
MQNREETMEIDEGFCEVIHQSPTTITKEDDNDDEVIRSEPKKEETNTVVTEFVGFYPSRWPEHEKQLVDCYAEELKFIINRLIKEQCYGCQTDHPSQIQHDKCLMLTGEEQLDEFLEDAWSNISETDVLTKWYKILQKYSSPPLIPKEIKRIEGLIEQSEKPIRDKFSWNYKTDQFKFKVRCALLTQYFCC